MVNSESSSNAQLESLIHDTISDLNALHGSQNSMLHQVSKATYTLSTIILIRSKLNDQKAS